eukprot:COSAG02_NODE_28682_length_584_cov_3.043299_1_plen_68_part_01
MVAGSTEYIIQLITSTEGITKYGCIIVIPTPYHINANRRFQPRSEPSGGRPSQVVQRQKPLAEAERMA